MEKSNERSNYPTLQQLYEDLGYWVDQYVQLRNTLEETSEEPRIERELAFNRTRKAQIQCYELRKFIQQERMCIALERIAERLSASDTGPR